MNNTIRDWKPVITSLLGHLFHEGINLKSVYDGHERTSLHDKNSAEAIDVIVDALLATGYASLAVIQAGASAHLALIVDEEPVELVNDWTVTGRNNRVLCDSINQAVANYEDDWVDRPIPQITQP